MMKTLRTYILLLFVAMFSGCSEMFEDTTNTPQIFFEAPRYTFLGESCVIKLKTNKPFDKDTKVPFKIHTTEGKEGVDYNFKQDYFLFKKGELEAELIVKPEDVVKEMNFFINCTVAPEGYILGLRDYTVLSVANIKYSFASREETLADVTELTVELRDSKNNRYIVEEDYTVAVEVSDKSTAVEGVHYEFVGKPEVLFKKGQRSSSIKVRKLGKTEKNKDVLILKLKTSNRLQGGTRPEVKLTIKDLVNIEGTWVLQGISNKKEADAGYGDFGITCPGFSTGNGKDEITFTKNDAGVMRCSFNMIGELKDYFNEEQDIILSGTKRFVFNDSKVKGRKEVTVYTFPKLNYAISATKKEIKEGTVKFFMLDSGELLITIDNFNTKEVINFDFSEFGMSSEDYPLNFLFKKKG